jgi:hypothetical protein
MVKQIKKRSKAVLRKAALTLLRDPRIIFLVMVAVGALGVVGERRNRLILFLAGITKETAMPVSVLIRGPSGCGKSRLIRTVLRLFPPECILARSSLSKKALAHGREPLVGKILYLNEFQGGKDVLYDLRQQQTEGEVSHEYTVVNGRERRTSIAKRTGLPVVMSTTTAPNIPDDDLTRNLNITPNLSPEQTRAILRAQAGASNIYEDVDLEVWNEAIRLVCEWKGEFETPPWFCSIVDKLPLRRHRIRRDWPRVISLCQAVALCRRFSTGEENSEKLIISLADYCVVRQVLKDAFLCTTLSVSANEIALARAVKELSEGLGQPVMVGELAGKLGWERALVYKHAKKAIAAGLIAHERKTHRNNLKRLLPLEDLSNTQLPSPQSLLDEIDEVGKEVRYVNPLTGKPVHLKRRRASCRLKSHR